MVNFIYALWPYLEGAMARPTLKYFENKPIIEKKSHKEDLPGETINS